MIRTYVTLLTEAVAVTISIGLVIAFAAIGCDARTQDMHGLRAPVASASPGAPTIPRWKACGTHHGHYFCTEYIGIPKR